MKYHEAIPMGFETKLGETCMAPKNRIMKPSLWDLKLVVPTVDLVNQI